MDRPFFSQRRLPIVFTAIAIALIGMNLYLLRVNQRLVDQRDSSLAELRRRAEAPKGTRMPPITGTAIDGTKQTVNYDASRSTLILVFAPECPSCDRAWPIWRAVTSATQSAFRSVALSISTQVAPSAHETYLASRGVPFSQFLHLTAGEVFQAYRLGLTPQLILVSPDGDVLGVRTGPALYNSTVDDLTGWVDSLTKNPFDGS